MEENQKVWFASDHHFGHEFMRKLRNFDSTDDMDQAIIDAHNQVVSKGDDVYLLGDFTFKSSKAWHYYTDALNGNLHLIRGNHDKIALDGKQRGFSWVKDYYEGKFIDFSKPNWRSQKQTTIVMSHYPMYCWHSSNRGSIMLHGHTHNGIERTEKERGKIMDMEVHSKNDYKPWELQDILLLMQDRPIFAPDCENY